MKLYEQFATRGFHSCITTTFGIDFAAYETVVLPRLGGAGCFNNIALADAGMLGLALERASTLPLFAGQHYSAAGINARGVFHPKITLQIGRDEGRLMIGSANLTAPGLSGNLELAGHLRCSSDPTGERAIFASAWRYVLGFNRERSSGIEYQIQWLQARTPWLAEAEPADGPVTLADGTTAAFLADEPATGIAARFAELVGSRPVRRLTVMSPYWDPNLDALQFLAEVFQPSEFHVLIDSRWPLFPATKAADLPTMQLFDLGNVADQRFVHAKAIVVETETDDHMLYGSANCSIAALGNRTVAGYNAEACLYRKVPAGESLDRLGLSVFRTRDNRLTASALPELEPTHDTPLAEDATRSPGVFELRHDMLTWWPPEWLDEEAAIECVVPGDTTLAVTLVELARSSSPARRFRVSGPARPMLAKLRLSDGTKSGTAIITQIDQLREVVREARSNRAEAAASRLAEETEVGFWLWDIFNEFEAAEAAQHDPGIRRSRAPNATDEMAEEPVPHRTLSYDEFIAGRRVRPEVADSHQNSLAGRDVSLLRDFLNRLLSIGDDVIEASPVGSTDTSAGLDLGDETSDPATAIEGGEQFALPPIKDEGALEESVAQARAKREKATRDQVIGAVTEFLTRIGSKMEKGGLNSTDILRLRVLLVIVAATSQSVADDGSDGRESIQVLSGDGAEEQSWPKQIGRMLFRMFGGAHPAIRHLQIDDAHDGLPSDLLEAWATVLWSAQACTAAMKKSQSASENLVAITANVAARAYRLTALTRNEFDSANVQDVFDRLNERFTSRLGLDREQISKAHEHSTREIFDSRDIG